MTNYTTFWVVNMLKPYFDCGWFFILFHLYSVNHKNWSSISLVNTFAFSALNDSVFTAAQLARACISCTACLADSRRTYLSVNRDLFEHHIARYSVYSPSTGYNIASSRNRVVMHTAQFRILLITFRSDDERTDI